MGASVEQVTPAISTSGDRGESVGQFAALLLQFVDRVVPAVTRVNVDCHDVARQAATDVGVRIAAAPPLEDRGDVGCGVEHPPTAADCGNLAAQRKHRPIADRVLDSVRSNVRRVDDVGAQLGDRQRLVHEKIDCGHEAPPTSCSISHDTTSVSR